MSSRTSLHTAAVTLGALALLFVLYACTGCARKTTTQPRPTTTPTTTTTVPTALTDIESHAEDIYDTIYARNWKKASSEFQWFSSGEKRLTTTVKGQEPEKRAIHDEIGRLGKSITAKNRQASLESANRISLLAIQMTQPYHPAVPIAITRLDYDGRELQIWSAAKDMAKLQATAKDIEQTWSQVRPQVIQHGGTKQAQRFDQLVANVKQAKTPADYEKQATPILDEVDNLEQVFTK